MSRRTLYHVSPSVNRESIRAHGLDPRLMGAALGIAGSERRELDGVFVCHDLDEVAWFADMGLSNVDAVDVWEIDDPGSVLQTNTANYEYLPLPVPPERVRLLETRTESREAEQLPDAEETLDGERFAAIAQSRTEYAVVVETADGERVRLGPELPPPEPAPPLPPELAADLALVLRDVDRVGAIAPGWRLAAVPTEPWFAAEDFPEDDDEDGPAYDWIEVDLTAVDGGPIARFMALSCPDAAERQTELAVTVQRHYIEHPQIDGTLHPPCAAGHPHAAVAAVRDGAAWWTCPATDGLLAPIGSYDR